MVKYAGRGLVVERPGVLSKVQMLNLLSWGWGSFPFFQTTADRVLHLFSLAFMWYRASITEIPLLNEEYRTSSTHAADAWGEGYRSESLHIETPKTPQRAIGGHR